MPMVLPTWCKIIVNPEPKKNSIERLTWTRYSLDFYAPKKLPSSVETALIEGCLTMLGVLAVLRYKKILADMTKDEIQELIDSITADHLYQAHRELVSTLHGEYYYLTENETGVAEV